MRYNFRAEGYSITDEAVVRSDNTASRIGHDLIKQAGFEVWTGEGKTGTQLVEGTDYALSVKDVKRSTEAAFDIYTLFAVTNASYEGVTLYLSYTACGDYLSVENIQEMAAAGVRNIIEPIGTIKPHPVGLPGVVALGSEFQLCDGSVVLDAASPMNGNRVPNLVGADVVLSVVWTADAGGAYGTIPVADTYALGVHDYVAGTGIAEHSVIKSIDYATGTIVISDPAATGAISCTITNEGRGIIGGAFGSVGDQMQQITGSISGSARGNPSFGGTFSGAFANGVQSSTGAEGATGTRGASIDFDSANSPYARTSADTWGKTKADAYSMGIYIKIKNVS
jgi:hypothetical protein